VLDLGSGAGDMAFVAAELVGSDGSVVGVDQSAEAVAHATRRAHDRGLPNVEFSVGDVSEPAPGGPYDAITGRLVLMYVADPAAVLRTQATILRAGGLIAPVELDVTTGRSVPPTPLVELVYGWVRAAFEHAGITPALGPSLWSVLVEAGLTPLGILGAQPMFGPSEPTGPALIAGIVRTILQVIERAGVATVDEVDVTTLQDRLATELVGANAVFAHPTLYCAWARHD
jgi:SAM-dependent methyltransferase